MKIGDLVKILPQPIQNRTQRYANEHFVGETVLVIDVVYHAAFKDKAWVAEVYNPHTGKGMMIAATRLEVVR